MNKDFEKAYKELAEIEVPDLWNRIEAGLSEKSAPGTEKKTNSLLIFIKRYSALAAAVVCAVIIIPAIIVTKQAMGGKLYSESASAGTSSEETFDTTEAFDAAEMAEETVDEESFMEAETASVTEESSPEEPEKETEDMPTENVMAAAEERTMGDTTEAADSIMEDAQAKKQQAQAEKQQENEVITNLIVMITEVEDFTIGEGVEDTGSLCSAVVQSDPAEALTPGENIDIFIPVYSSIALMKGGTFELDIALLEGEEDIYRIVKYHGQLEEQTDK